MELEVQSIKIQSVTAVITAFALIVFAFWASDQEGGKAAAFAFVCGAAFGAVMQKSRFCFYCHIREYIEDGDPRGVLSLLLAIAIGIIGYTAVMSSWLPSPSLAGSLPPDVHIGPVSEIVVIAGAVFGLGMALSGSCIGAHFYHLGEGSFESVAALVGAGFGFFLGFNTWNALYSYRIAEAPLVWLPAHIGYGWSLILQLGAIAAVAAFVWRGFAARRLVAPARKLPTVKEFLLSICRDRWSFWIGGALIALIGIVALVRVKPLGVTATLGSWVRSIAGEFGLIPAKLNGLDGFAGCGSLPQNYWFNADSLLLLGLVVGSFIAALAGGNFAIERTSFRALSLALLGGVLLGWGAMTALGCTIGTLLSGTQAGALSGWLFGGAMLLALWGALTIKRRFLQKA
ncbi:membrane protein [Campylobacterota bacterium]|nr:membrane protein [Campylobacterota bacterium]